MLEIKYASHQINLNVRFGPGTLPVFFNVQEFSFFKIENYLLHSQKITGFPKVFVSNKITMKAEKMSSPNIIIY